MTFDRNTQGGLAGFLARTWSDPERRWLVLILAIGALLRVGMALYLGNTVVPTTAAYDQIYFHDVALNLLAGKGFAYIRTPWPFFQPYQPTAYTSFLYQLFLAGVYWLFGVRPLVARTIQALICSLLPLLAYVLVRRVLRQPPARSSRAGAVALLAAGITACYAYFVYYSATLMTEGLYLVAVTWSLVVTYDVAEAPTARRWALWGLAAGIATLLRQVFMPMAAVEFLFILWRIGRRTRLAHVAAAVAVLAALILPFTVRNYLVFHRFLLLNSQAGHILWTANHPSLGTRFDPSVMAPIPDDLQGANEVDLTNELGRRAVQNILAEPRRFLLLSLDRLGILLTFWPKAESSTFSNIARPLSFGVFLPFMLLGIAMSLKDWRRWLLLYVFILVYTGIHVISWVQFRYRMPIDLALIPFAALALVALAARAGLGELSIFKARAPRPPAEPPLPAKGLTE